MQTVALIDYGSGNLRSAEKALVRAADGKARVVVTRDPEAVLEDVILGYVTLEGAERDYGVKISCSKRPDERISLPEHYALDLAATQALRTASGEPTDPA